MKTKALALMETASFCAGVRYKRYSVQQETAPKYKPLNLCYFETLNLFLKNQLFKQTLNRFF